MIYMWYDPTDGKVEAVCSNPCELVWNMHNTPSSSVLMIPLALGDWDCG